MLNLLRVLRVMPDPDAKYRVVHIAKAYGWKPNEDVQFESGPMTEAQADAKVSKMQAQGVDAWKVRA